MRIYTCISDIGSALVGNKDVRFALPNIGGDGTTFVYIFESEGELSLFPQYANKLSFVTSIEGKFNLFSYDCSHGADEDVITTLEGRYGVYRGDHIVGLVKWE